MKFMKGTGTNGLLLPVAAMRLAGISAGEKVEYHVQDGAVVVLKGRMTAMELASALQSLHALSVELGVKLIEACGLCKDCAAGCPPDAPDQLLRQGLSADTLETLLSSGICLKKLAQLMKEDRVISG